LSGNETIKKKKCVSPLIAEIHSLEDWEALNNSHDWDFVQSEKTSTGARTTLRCRRCGVRRVAMIVDDDKKQEEKTI